MSLKANLKKILFLNTEGEKYLLLFELKDIFVRKYILEKDLFNVVNTKFFLIISKDM